MEKDDFAELFGSIQVLTGMKPTYEVQTNPAQSKYFISKIQSMFPQVTWLQAETAFELVANGFINEEVNKTLSIQSFSKIIRAYLRSLKTEANPDDPPELTEHEILEIVARGICSEFEMYKTKGIVFNFGNATFNYLENWQMLGFTDDELAEITKRAETAYREALHSRKTAHNSQKITEAIAEFNDGNTNQAYEKCLGSEKIKAFFKSLIEMDAEFIDMMIGKNIITQPQAYEWELIN